jgi:peptidoglycan/xylan/chitin deacetylase (PgdA/CDA1 family)
MIGNVCVGVGTRQWAVVCVVLLACITAQSVWAADCPGHPDALGTSRTLVVDPREHPRIGTMQYAETLPLEDHEVVLTFDDGPLPKNSNQVLQILASQCVKATFFTIGRMARAYPEGVRKLRDAGHSIGTHTQDHPLTMNHMSVEQAKQEIDDGMASTTTALGDPTMLAPFFRIPGLLRADAVEEYLASQGIQIWSADFLADDWRHISSSRVYELAMQRLEAKGKGILLLHDIQARTVAALPRILQELKVRGYRIVHVVPATLQQPATPTEPQQWQLHPPSEAVAISHWPKIPDFVFADAGMLAAPSLSDSDWHDGALLLAEPFDRARGLGPRVPLPRQALWPREMQMPPDSAAVALPIPARSVFEIHDRPSAPVQAAAHSPRDPAQTVPSAPEKHGRAKSASAEDSRPRHAQRAHTRVSASKIVDRGGRPAAHARRGTLKHLVQVKKRSV